jgi:hypothetical protein
MKYCYYWFNDLKKCLDLKLCGFEFWVFKHDFLKKKKGKNGGRETRTHDLWVERQVVSRIHPLDYARPSLKYACKQIYILYKVVII